MQRIISLFKTVCVSSSLFVLCCTANAAPNPKVLVERMAAIYKKAHTLQQIWVAEVNLGQQLHFQLHIDNKSEGLKLHVISSLQTTSNSPAEKMMESIGKTEIVSDGANLYTYRPYNNSYTVTHLDKGAMKSEEEGALTSSIGVSNVINVVKGKYILLKDTKVGATPVWVVEVVPIAKPSEHSTYYINRMNDHLKKLIIDTISPYGGTMNITLSLVKETLNAYLSPTLFRFVPPKNAHLVKAMDMGGMMAGGM